MSTYNLLESSQHCAGVARTWAKVMYAELKACQHGFATLHYELHWSIVPSVL